MKNSKNDFEAVAEFLGSHDSYLVFAHVNPDGDAVGSSIAIGLALKQMGKTVDYALYGCEDRISAILPESRLFSQKFEKRYDCALILDSSTKEYIKNNEELTRCGEMVLIDHHVTNEGYANINLIRPKAAACGEVVFDLLCYMGIGFTEEMVNALFIALWEDTGGFAFSNTTADTHRIAAELYKLSIKLNDVIDELKMYPVESLYLKKNALNGLELFDDKKIVMMVLSYDNGYYPYRDIDTTALIDLCRYVRECKLAVMIKQIGKNDYKISLRSNSDRLDVSEFAIRYGGGGHAKASGFTFTGELAEVKEIIKGYFREQWTV